jgi:hypothetical protein
MAPKLPLCPPNPPFSTVWWDRFCDAKRGFHVIRYGRNLAARFVFNSMVFMRCGRCRIQSPLLRAEAAVDVISTMEDAALYRSLSAEFMNQCGYCCQKYVLSQRSGTTAHTVSVQSEFHLVNAALKRWVFAFRRTLLRSRRRPLGAEDPLFVPHLPVSNNVTAEEYTHTCTAPDGRDVSLLSHAVLRCYQGLRAGRDVDSIATRQFVHSLRRLQSATEDCMGATGWKCAGLTTVVHPFLSLALKPWNPLSLRARWLLVSAWLRDLATACLHPAVAAKCLQRAVFTVGGPHLLFTLAVVILRLLRDNGGLVALAVHFIDAPARALWSTIASVLATVVRQQAPILDVVLVEAVLEVVLKHVFVYERYIPSASSLISIWLCSSVVSAVPVATRIVCSALTWRMCSRWAGVQTTASIFAGTYTTILSVVLLLLRLRWHARDDLFNS